MQNDTIWELPFGDPAELELRAEWGNLTFNPIRREGDLPRLELSRQSAEHIVVHVEKVGNAVRVAIEPQRNFNWFGGWEAKATVYVPRNVHAAIQTNAGSVTVEDLVDCELGIKANAGKIDLRNVYGLMHLAADAGSVSGRDVGGFFDVETQAGSIRLDILDLQPGEHRIRAAMGSVRLELVRGMDVCVETRTSLGSVRNNFPSRQEAPARLLLSTEMGSVRVDEGARRAPVWRPTAANFTPERPPAPTRPMPPNTPVESTTPANTPAGSTPAGNTAAGNVPKREDPELNRILQMVESGQLSAQDADELLKAMGRV
jgi:hypothetical protein